MELLQNCRDHAHQYYGDLLLAAEKSLTNSLFEQAEKCSNNEDQRRYYEAMQQLKANGGAMQAGFRQQLEANYQSFVSGRDTEISLDEPTDISNLALVKLEKLEDELAISVIVSKSNSRNTETLWKLNRRMAVLRGGKNVSDETNPFGPAMVCAALQVAITQLSLGGKSKILVYKHLGSIFVISFVKELNALNDLLQKNNILPNLRVDNSSATDSAQFSASLVESDSSISHQRELYKTIQTLQSSLRTRTAGDVSFEGVSTDGDGGTDSFSGSDYALALSTIQQSEDLLSSATLHRPLSAEQVEKKLFGQLSQLGSNQAHHKMTSEDANTVDLVGMIFRYMLDDPNLHDAVKSLLSHLHTPYLKLALMDKTFMDNYQHSARVLLNTMAKMGGEWVKEDDDRMVLPKIKATVENILKGFVDDISIFDRLLEDISRFRYNLDKRARMVEKRNAESQLGLEKLEISKQHAIEEIEERFNNSNISDIVADLLRKPWTDFLAFNLLRHGGDSLAWKSALRVLDGVIWSVQPGGAGDDLHRRQAEWEKTVSEGLITIGYDAEVSKTLLNSLMDAQKLASHNAAMNGEKESNTQPSTSERGDTSTTNTTVTTTTKNKAKLQTKPKETLDVKPAKLSPEEQGMVDKLKDIAFGTWFEFDQRKAVTRLKLAWFSRISSRYMFVDHLGVKQMVETQNNLAKGMCSGTIRVIEAPKKSFMERALEAVFNKLNTSS